MLRRLLSLLFSLVPLLGYATHIRGGEMRVISANTLTIRIQITMFTNTGSEIKFGEGLLNFGDGNSMTTPTIDNTVIDASRGLGMVTFSVDHTYATKGYYILSYIEPNLVGGILNMTNSVETRFQLETGFLIDDDNHAYISPEFPTIPIFYGISGNDYSFSTAALDTDNECSYRYTLYTFPTSRMYIRDYMLPGNMSINSLSGGVTWNSMFHGEFTAGDFYIMPRIDMYNKDGVNVGYVTRGIQLTMEDYPYATRISSSVTDKNNRVVVKDGEQQKIKVFFSNDDQEEEVTFDAYFNTKLSDNIVIDQYDSINVTKKGRVAEIAINTTPDIVSDKPYTITLRAKARFSSDITFLYNTKDIPKDPDDVVTGIDEKNALSVYPNPFKSELFINGSHATFINMLGEVVLQSSIQKDQPLNTSNLSSGLYFLQVKSDSGEISIFKLVRN